MLANTQSYSFYSFVSRWIFSTNHKDIETLYLIFVAVYKVAGTMLSLDIRFTLAQPNSSFLENELVLYVLLRRVRKVLNFINYREKSYFILQI